MKQISARKDGTSFLNTYLDSYYYEKKEKRLAEI
jgi:hypothetical protein